MERDSGSGSEKDVPNGKDRAGCTLLRWYSQPKLVQTGAQVCQQRHKVVYEKSDGACTSSQKIAILSHRKASAEPDGIFRQKPLEDYVTKEHL
jgi:hypothetical protein